MLNEKTLYQKAEAEVICFDNTDVITASGGDGECRVPGWDRGNNCPGPQSANCPSRAWK